MYGSYSRSDSYNGEPVFTEHAGGHISRRGSQYSISRNDDADRPTLEELNCDGYGVIERLVKSTFPYCNISHIYQVHARQMYGMYMLRHEEMKLTVDVQEMLLYHVTTESRACESLTSGLDWRRTRRSMFGCGVSFSDDADYGNYYADSYPGVENRVLMICSVLIGEKYVIPRQNDGNSLIVPPGRADTTVSHNGRVFVKYNDNEFYPHYFVYYQWSDEQFVTSKYYQGYHIRLPHPKPDYSNYRNELSESDDYSSSSSSSDYDAYYNSD